MVPVGGGGGGAVGQSQHFQKCILDSSNLIEKWLIALLTKEVFIDKLNKIIRSRISSISIFLVNLSICIIKSPMV